ncbi:hypothetical protein [Deinococcus radiotolerans]|uniref:Uncharacterized protein n=1 Tax=Deinococcus radiotolerans TaxID=1309407 RepID=A0ABQ2FR70_9DEIO|nr:hypothetical protein [Deinococcus radiotolerans]GGL18506.1 hypothetical protein GCM10010844_41670 [Deinococcus radiotolerans]
MTVSEWFKLGMAEAIEAEQGSDVAEAADAVRRCVEYAESRETFHLFDGSLKFMLEVVRLDEQRKLEASRSMHRRILGLALNPDPHKNSGGYLSDLFSRPVRRKRGKGEPAGGPFYWAVDAHYLISEWSRDLLDVLAALARTGLLSGMVVRRFALYLRVFLHNLIKTRFTISTGIQPARKTVTLRTIQACAP